MKLNLKAFVISMVIIVTVPWLLLFIWCGINGFGVDLVRIFESIHPAGAFSVAAEAGKGIGATIVAAIINTVYVAVDTFIVSLVFVLLYNWFAGIFSPEEQPEALQEPTPEDE